MNTLSSRTDTSGNQIWSSKDLLEQKSKITANVYKEELSTKGAFILHNILSLEECEKIVTNSKSMGFTEAALNLGNGKLVVRRQERCCGRILLEVLDLSILWERLKPHLNFTSIGRNEYEPVGLNPRLRILKYTAGQFFRKHYDGGHNQSLMTLIIYLSDGCKGGETNFYKGSKCVDSVRPKAGSALLFFHDRHPLSPLHEGSEVSRGEKYVLRTDVYFQKV